jgi:pimeloyl-ACP methyl ester carboxylesterase
MNAGRAIFTGALIALVSVCAPVALSAQDRPVVFVHGLGSSPDTWAGAAQRLSGRLAIDARSASVSWRQSYESQAGDLQAGYGWLPSSTVAIGHSNGGIVAREWSKSHPLSGLVTVGTPNQGAPLAANLPMLFDFNWWIGYSISDVYASFGDCCDWQWVLGQLGPWLGLTQWLSTASLSDVVTTLGVSVGVPVIPQMSPFSPYLNDLNGGGNLGREAASVSARVGIVSIASNFYDLGVFGAVAGDNAEYFDYLSDAAVGVFDYWAWYITATASPHDWAAQSKANRLWSLSAWIASWDSLWCQAVSWPGGGWCAPNDTVVPAWSQTLPGPGAQQLDWGWSGPVHTKETERSDDLLYTALTAFLHVPPRSSGGVPGGSSPRDIPSSPGTLPSGGVLHSGQSVSSSDGRFSFTYQTDGNLVLYRNDGTPLWASHTSGTAAGQAAMQGDGNLVIYDTYGTPLWASHTNGYAGAWLQVETSGNVVVYAPGGAPVWSTGTAGW